MNAPSFGIDQTDSTEPTAAPKKAPVAYEDAKRKHAERGGGDMRSVRSHTCGAYAWR